MQTEEEIAKPDMDFERSSLDGATRQLITNMEKFHDASIILVGQDGAIDYYNSRAMDLFEVPQTATAEYTNFTDLLGYLAERGDFGPGQPEQFVNIAQNALEGNYGSNGPQFQTYMTMPSGNILRVLIHKNKDGTIAISGQDVSDKRRKENMLEMALDIGFAGYIVRDLRRGTYNVESRYLSGLLTASEFQQLEKLGPSTLSHSDDIERSQNFMNTVIETGEPQHGTTRIVTEKEGVRWFRFVIMPEGEDERSNRIITFFNDITDSLRQQENLRQAKQLAEESLRSKEDFLARMSHEIRTPMNGVIGIADALIHHHADDAINPKLELIQKSANSILKMLDETLTFSRLGNESFALNPANDSPAEVVSDVCALWEQQALKNGGVIRCTIKDDVPDKILFDKYRYEQCVNNLLSNAVKFTHGGKIDVVLTTVTKPGKPQSLVLAVRDTGIGMTPEQQARIFDAFAQADQSISSRFGGTGLGMNITKQIVERMGGSISVRSEIGNGSLFAMSIPLMAADGGAAILDTVPAPTSQPSAKPTEDTAPSEVLIQLQPQTEPPSDEFIEISDTSTGLIDDMLERNLPDATRYSSLNILVVDDNSTNHLVINSLLGSLVAKIHVASDGTEALNILDTTPIDIVLMDIHMPVMDGIECTLAIRSSQKPWKDVLIIALTADPQYQQKKLCKNIGMDEALGKPVRLNDLMEAIDNVLPDEANSDETEAAA